MLAVKEIQKYTNHSIEAEISSQLIYCQDI